MKLLKPSACSTPFFHDVTTKESNWKQGGRCCASARAALTERSGSSTKGRTPNIRYFVAKLSNVAIYALFERLSQGFQRKPSCFQRAVNESHPAFKKLSMKAILFCICSNASDTIRQLSFQSKITQVRDSIACNFHYTVRKLKYVDLKIFSQFHSVYWMEVFSFVCQTAGFGKHSYFSRSS